MNLEILKERKVKILFLDTHTDQQKTLYSSLKGMENIFPISVKSIFDLTNVSWTNKYWKNNSESNRAIKKIGKYDIIISSYAGKSISSRKNPNRKNSYWIELWHGAPLKDINNKRNKWLKMDSNSTPISKFVSQNPWNTKKLYELGWTDTRMIFNDYPRIEYYKQFNKNTSLDSLGLDKEKIYKSLILTWRNYSTTININQILETLENNEILLISKHYSYKRKMINLIYDEKYNDKIIELNSEEHQIGDIYSVSGFLWTDYSSAIFDFISLKGINKVAIFRNEKDDLIFDKLLGRYNDFEINENSIPYPNHNEIIGDVLKRVYYLQPKVPEPKQTQESINVVYSFNKSVESQFLASVKSLIKHNPNANIFVISSENLSQYSKSFLKKKNAKINFIKIKPSTFLGVLYDSYGINNDFGRFSFATLFRFLIPQYLSFLDRVIYLDTDTRINKPLDKLFNYNLNSNAIGAVKDIAPFSKTSWKKIDKNKENFSYFAKRLKTSGHTYKKYLIDILKYDENNQYEFQNYVNAGVMLIDISKFKINLTLSDYKKKLPYLDQDIINIKFKNNIQYLPHIFNFNKSTLSNYEPPSLFQKKKQGLRYMKEAYISHYIGKKTSLLQNTRYRPFFFFWLCDYKKFNKKITKEYNQIRKQNKKQELIKQKEIIKKSTK